MAKAIEQIRVKKGKTLTVGHAGLGYRSGVVGSIRQEVHDGDTINVRAIGNFGVRFLGVDAPELSFQLPGQQGFSSLSSSEWQNYLNDPFSVEYAPFNPPLDQELKKNLKARVGQGAASNQYRHSKIAEEALEKEVKGDLKVSGSTEDDFRFFLAFSFEITDRYGRLLCFINREQPSEDRPEKRPASYNERLLYAGVVSPYFIWPNIDPFRTKGKNVADAVIPPGTAKDEARKDPNLEAARQAFKEARRKSIGLFDGQDRLRLEPFEVRYLGRRSPPDRWVIDLSKNDDRLIDPQDYFKVFSEDRLYIPREYIPLFLQAGWRKT